MFDSKLTIAAFSLSLAALIIDLSLTIFWYVRVVNSCTIFFGKGDALGPTIGRLIDVNDFCFCSKSQAQSAGGLLLAFIFVYLITCVGSYTRHRFVQAVNLVACLPLEFLFGILAIYVGAAANNSTYTRRGNSTVVILGVVVFLINLAIPFLVYFSLWQNRKAVVRLPRDDEEERREQTERFEMRVQAYSNQIQQHRQSHSSGAAAGRGAAGGGRGRGARGRGGRGGRGGATATTSTAADVDLKQSGKPAANAGSSDQYVAWAQTSAGDVAMTPANGEAAAAVAAAAASAPAVGSGRDAYQPPVDVTADGTS